MPKSSTQTNDLPLALSVSKRGKDLLNDPLLNKGTAFSAQERNDLKLRALLPAHVSSIEEQIQCFLDNHADKAPLERYIHLEGLHNRNETLYYRILVDHLQQMTPTIYTPVVGEACQDYGRIFRDSRGLYLSFRDQGNFQEILDQCEEEVSVIVVTDGSRILGLGDLGANGMGISIGKLALYVACAGIPPQKTLPVVLDMGTSNENLLKDPYYLGERSQRVENAVLHECVDEFMKAATKRWPNVLIQFEDFRSHNAIPLLKQHRDSYLSFNDDIQGTGSVILAGLLGALRITKSTLQEQRIVFFGAGSAAIGIADMIVAGMEAEGMTEEEAKNTFWFLDSKGLVTDWRSEAIAEHKLHYVRHEKHLHTLLEVVEKVKPTVLMGLSGQGGAFTEDVIRAMYKHNPLPVIFALSNPTHKTECSAEDAYRWTDGRAIYSSGSPFAPVTLRGKYRVPGQGNNMYIFPGVGLGAVLCKTKKITDTMFYAASIALSKKVSDEDLEQHCVYPKLTLIREVSEEIAVAVCKVAFKEELAQIERPDDLKQFVREQMYFPCYQEYRATE